MMMTMTLTAANNKSNVYFKNAQTTSSKPGLDSVLWVSSRKQMMATRIRKRTFYRLMWKRRRKRRVQPVKKTKRLRLQRLLVSPACSASVVMTIKLAL